MSVPYLMYFITTNIVHCKYNVNILQEKYIIVDIKGEKLILRTREEKRLARNGGAGVGAVAGGYQVGNP